MISVIELQDATIVSEGSPRRSCAARSERSNISKNRAYSFEALIAHLSSDEGSAMSRTIAIAVFLICLSRPSDAGPLHDAAMAGDIAQIKLLLSRGADINEQSSGGTPLYMAVNSQHVEAAELFILSGADVNAASTWGAPLHAAAAKGLTSIGELLLDRGANTEARTRGMTPLHLAAQNGQLQMVQLLLDHGADINAVTSVDEPALHLAIAFRHLDVANLLAVRGTRAPPVDSIESLLATANPEHGEKLALLCKECHSIERNSIKKGTPPLWGVVGRPKASVAGIRYSEALKALGGAWTYSDLNRYIAQPAWTAPGVAMKMPGVHEAKDRADIIAFLRSLSDSPEPLP